MEKVREVWSTPIEGYLGLSNLSKVEYLEEEFATVLWAKSAAKGH